MKHKLFTPIIALCGAGGVATPIAIQVTGVSQETTSTEANSSPSAQQGAVTETEPASLERRDAPPSVTSPKRKRPPSSLFL